MNEFISIFTFKSMMEHFELHYNGDKYIVRYGNVFFYNIFEWYKSAYSIEDLYGSYLVDKAHFIDTLKSRRYHA